MNYEEKYELMTEYMRETKKKIKAGTKYKGHNIGALRNNVRQAYFDGTLEMDDELLKKYIASGIISTEKERIKKTSQQEKYEFLMQLVGKSEDELLQAKMESGLPFEIVKKQLQADYRKGMLQLTPEQIEKLKKNGFLNYSREEQEKMAEENGLPIRYVTDITRKYGSYEEFIEQYKKGRTDYDFGKDVFCGYRGVTISEREMTEEQKQRYIILLKDLLEPGEDFDLSFENGDYIDIDRLRNCIDAIPDRHKKTIEWYYGLNGEKLTYSQIGERLGILRGSALSLRQTAIKYIKNHKQTNEPMKNIKIMLQQYESRCKNIQDCISDIEVVKLYIADENRKIRQEDSNIPLVANTETRQSYMETLLQRCNMLLEICKSKMERLEKYRREEIEPELARYNEARDNYLNKENIFDPKGIVPAVTSNRENDEISQPENLEENSSASAEQKKKEELIKSIVKGQQELERLRAILANLGISLE